MRTAASMIDKRFGRLLVLAEHPERIRKNIAYVCRCDCGETKVVNGANLRGGVTNSCGCLAKETASSQMLKHGMFGTPEYSAWAAMIQRCTNPKAQAYANYGGRGITVCRRWLSFENFLSDLGRRPNPRFQLERKNNNRGYSPGNCEWTTRKRQARNRRSTIWITYKGRRTALVEAAELAGFERATILRRYHAGWSAQELFAPLKQTYIPRNQK